MSLKPSWEDLMVEAQKGNSGMYHTLLTEVSSYLSPYLRMKVRDAEAVADLLQEVLLSLHKARHTFDATLPFKPWLFKIVHSRLVDHYRKSGSKEDFALVQDDTYFDSMSAEAEISQVEIRVFQRAVERLPEDQRKILLALKLEGKTISAVSSEMAMSESAVKVAAHRAYKRLHDLMEAEV